MYIYYSEFEEITRDLLQKEWNCLIESFTSGRDGGIDLRCATEKEGKAIIQAKRYKDYKSLLANLILLIWSAFQKMIALLRITS
ncbi:hypothetical protein EEL33_18895 [Muribaculaceae bacterium Isolate-037 (Harlan)]|uniref:Uncharacterized protein n=1 Tax=Lepagella muris TaxID=3032870 RepID=A0AC61RMR8_9BACT|nr:hypothetical protein EEL33_18895 [Muribaculaceae bacterium Isolate-037 (Harlan)]TGY80359.1 hypothetical protein E5331_03405 [Lepagella muris]THG52897.1 restriction endonuclease [Bacteroidales bacterium]TKC58757.1 restriction endonuclease [Bacteroidales bacterium]